MSSSEPSASMVPPDLSRPVQEFSEDGVDLGLIRWMLTLTPTQRLEAAQDLIDTVWMLREGGAA